MRSITNVKNLGLSLSSEIQLPNLRLQLQLHHRPLQTTLDPSSAPSILYLPHAYKFISLTTTENTFWGFQLTTPRSRLNKCHFKTWTIHLMAPTSRYLRQNQVRTINLSWYHLKALQNSFHQSDQQKILILTVLSRRFQAPSSNWTSKTPCRATPQSMPLYSPR